ncbi:hypothetical protein Btru_027250 [Bulinus truncatus]|nr:hypothetical protein Btru_027250 [Bulinus truncatus]
MATLGGLFPPPPPPATSITLIRDTANDRTPMLAYPARYNTVLPHHQPMIYGMYGAQPTVPYATAMHNPHLIPGYLQVQQMLYAQQDINKMITPFTKVLDRPKSQSSQESGEFVSLLGSVQLHPTPGGSTEFVPGSNYLSLNTDTLLDIDPPVQHAEQVLTSSEKTGAQENTFHPTSKQQTQHVSFALGSFRQQPTAHHDHIGSLARALLVVKSNSDSISEAETYPLEIRLFFLPQV